MPNGTISGDSEVIKRAVPGIVGVPSVVLTKAGLVVVARHLQCQPLARKVLYS